MTSESLRVHVWRPPALLHLARWCTFEPFLAYVGHPRLSSCRAQLPGRGNRHLDLWQVRPAGPSEHAVTLYCPSSTCIHGAWSDIF